MNGTRWGNLVGLNKLGWSVFFNAVLLYVSKTAIFAYGEGGWTQNVIVEMKKNRNSGRSLSSWHMLEQSTIDSAAKVTLEKVVRKVTFCTILWHQLKGQHYRSSDGKWHGTAEYCFPCQLMYSFVSVENTAQLMSLCCLRLWTIDPCDHLEGRCKRFSMYLMELCWMQSIVECFDVLSFM